MIFLSNLDNVELCRVICYPDAVPRLNRETAIIIPTNDKEVFTTVANKLRRNIGAFRVKGMTNVFLPKLKSFRAGNKKIIYRNKDYRQDVKELQATGLRNVTFVGAVLRNYNTFVNYVELIQEMFRPDVKYLASNTISIWRSIIDFSDLQHKKKYLLFTKEIIKKNVRNRAVIKATNWRVKDVYISFLYNLIYNYDEMKSLLKSRDCSVIFTDYKYTFRIDFNDENFDTMFPDKDELFKIMFANFRKMNLGVPIEDEEADLEQIVEVPHTEEPIEEEQKDTSLTTAMKIVAKVKTLDKVTEEKEEELSKDDPIQMLDKMSDDLVKELADPTTEIKDDKKVTKVNSATIKAQKITEIVDKSLRKNIRVPERLETVEKRQAEIINNNLTEVLARLEKIADSLIVPDVINPEKKVFGTFSINKMDEQYEEIAKKDRLEIAESLNHTSVPLFLTKYKESKNMDVKDTAAKSIQMTFESPDNANDKYTFTMNVPELRDGKFLHINGSDKVMIRQKMALPIIKLDDAVVFTTYYNKMFIKTTNANLSKGVAKIKKYIKFIRKKFPSTYLKKWFSFTPAFYNARHENVLGPEALEISRYLSYIKIDENNWLDLSAKEIVAKVNGDDLRCSKHSDLFINEFQDVNLSVLEVFNKMIMGMEGKDNKLVEPWKTIYKAKASDNISYSTVKVMAATLPLVVVVLHALDENLLELLDIMSKDYGLTYDITPFKENKPVKKLYTDDEGSRLIFKDFTIDILYTSVTNRQLLQPLTNIDFSGYKSLQLKGFISEQVPSSNTVMEMEVYQDLFIDPITRNVMEDCGMPTNYAEALIYANSLLHNYDRTVAEISLVNERMPANSEVIQGAMYKVIADEYATYSKKRKRGSRLAGFSVEKDSIIKLLSTLPNVEESNKVNSIQHVDKLLTVSNKGMSGVNNDRSYTIQKRKWDKSFYGIMSDVSPYGPKTGVTKHLSVNPNITDIRGYFRTKKPEETAPDELMAVSEALGPFAQKHDSSPRTAMRMMQANHLMGTEGSEPALVTYGMDESMVSLDSDFAKRMRYDGEVLLVNDRYIKIRYDKKDDDGRDIEEIIELDEIDRNSAKAFFLPNKLVMANKYKNIKPGTKVKANTILAYNSNFYSEHGDEVIFKSGPVVNVALMNTQYAYEDATIMSESLARKLQVKLLKRIAVKLNPRNKIAEMNLNFGNITAGDMLIKYSEDSGSDFLSKMYDTSVLDDHLMKTYKCDYNGVLKDVYIYYKLTEAEKREMDPSIQKVIKQVDTYYKNTYNGNELAKNMPNYEINRAIEHVTEFTDNRKNKVNGDLVEKGQILIEFFVEVNQNFSAGDKITIGNTALKGVDSKILPDDEMPVGVKTGRRFDLILSTYSPLSRMLYSMFLVGPLTAAMQKINSDIMDIIKNHKE